MNKDVIEELGRKITGLLPEGGKQFQADIEANIKAAIQSSLSKLNVVTREEFDVQTALLERTREKLEALIQQLEDLDKNK